MTRTTQASDEQSVDLLKSEHDFFLSGSIELDELVQIIVTFYDLEDIPREDSEEHAKNIFQAMDVDGSGSLDEEEFVKGCTTDPDFCRVIQSSIEKLKTNQG